MNRRTLSVAIAGAVASLWLGACSLPGSHLPPAESSGAGDPGRGKQLIGQYGCGSCHVVPGVRKANGLVGPPLTSFGRRSYIAGEIPNNADNLQHWVADPQSIEPGTVMPDLGVSAVDARDIAAYLLSLG